MHGRHGFGGFGRGFGFEFPRVRRGDMKFLLLEILKDGPRHGYEIIGELETRFRGYRASPGSVYPTLQMLEEGGYVTCEEIEGKKVYTVTESGLQLLHDRGERPFEPPPHAKQAGELRESIRKLVSAVVDGARGTDEQTMQRINDVLNRTRREVYSILAES